MEKSATVSLASRSPTPVRPYLSALGTLRLGSMPDKERRTSLSGHRQVGRPPRISRQNSPPRMAQQETPLLSARMHCVSPLMALRCWWARLNSATVVTARLIYFFDQQPVG